jgi:hypothetical protein
VFGDRCDALSGTVSPIALDATGNPHIAYSASHGYLTHASFDGNSWQLENTGLQITPYAMLIASDGTIHIAGLSEPNVQVCEERRFNGNWAGECFDQGNGQDPPNLAFRPDGSPEVAYETDGYFKIKVAIFDGVKWNTDGIIDASAFGFDWVNDHVFAIDPAGVPKMMFVGQTGFQNLLIYGVETIPGTWTWTDLGRIDGMISGLSFELDPVGLPRVSLELSAPGVDRLAYAAQTLPVH